MSKKVEYQKYLQSAHWQQRRKQAIEDVCHACEKCDIPRWLAQIAYEQDLNVHHLSYQNLGREEDDDLEVLCRRCHEIETFGRSDYRAPKSTRCDACGQSHWDVYGGLCQVCSALVGLALPLSHRFDNLDPRTEEPIWQSVVAELCYCCDSGRIAGHEILAFASAKLGELAEYRKTRLLSKKSTTSDDDDIDFDCPF